MEEETARKTTMALGGLTVVTAVTSTGSGERKLLTVWRGTPEANGCSQPIQR